MSRNNSKVVSDWDNEYARLARVASQLRSGIHGNNNNQETSARALQTGLSRLESSLNHLPLAMGEIQRRKRLVQHLQQTSTPAAAAAAAAGGGAASASATADGGGGAFLQQSSQSSQMQMAMQQQDAMIDELAIGVGRLKNQTMAISEESTMHNRLLNDMDSNLDVAQQGLLDETNRAQRLRDDQSLWKLQLVVAGLVVLLILLILLGLS